jgi:hypothetical protein
MKTDGHHGGNHRLSTILPVCPVCHEGVFVRLERVLSGRRVSSAYYCGRCHHEWQIERMPPADVIERRVMERRSRSRLDST